MPNITQFDAGNVGLQPSEVGVESVAGAGRRLGAFYNQVGEATARFGEQAGREFSGAIQTAGDLYVLDQTRREVSHGSATFATMADNLTNQWNDVAKNADPNDPSVAGKFREEVLEPALDKFKQGFSTDPSQNWAEHHIEQLRQHFFEKTTADMSTLAGQAAHVNAVQLKNTLSNTVMNDPSGLKFALDTYDSSIGGIVASSPNIRGADAARVRSQLSEEGREQIVKSAAIGSIMKTGQVPSWVSDPEYSKYVNGIELKGLQKQAETQQRANLYYDRMNTTLKKQQADLQLHQDTSDFILNTFKVDPTDPNRYMVSPDAKQKALDMLRKNHEAPSASSTFETIDKFLDSVEKPRTEPLVSDPTVKADLLGRLSDPNKPTSKLEIMGAEANNKLSTRDGTILKGMVQEMGPELTKDPIIHAAIAGAQERLGMNTVIDGHERYSNFLQSFLPQYLAQKRAGTLQPNALNLKDENSLIRKSLEQFEPDPMDRMMGHIQKNLGANINLTGPGTTVSGVTVQNAPAFKPPPTWQYSPSRDQYRDPATKKVYDRAGREVK